MKRPERGLDAPIVYRQRKQTKGGRTLSDRAVFGGEDHSLPDHSIPTVHVEVEVEKGEPEFLCDGPMPVQGKRAFKRWQERMYPDDQIGWLGDK